VADHFIWRERDLRRFWAKVDRGEAPGVCWEWLGSVDRDGYGRFGIVQPVRNLAAHRTSYELFVDRIPDHLVIDHLCRNRGCVNPAHLEVVTNRVNLLRGRGIGARNAAKTHCTHGHPFDEKNTIYRRSGGRDCRTCRREIERRYLKRRAEKETAHKKRRMVPVVFTGSAPESGDAS
jgi:hypothetical protein